MRPRDSQSRSRLTASRQAPGPRSEGSVCGETRRSSLCSRGRGRGELVLEGHPVPTAPHLRDLQPTMQTDFSKVTQQGGTRTSGCQTRLVHRALSSSLGTVPALAPRTLEDSNPLRGPQRRLQEPTSLSRLPGCRVRTQVREGSKDEPEVTRHPTPANPFPNQANPLPAPRPAGRPA